MRVAFAAAALAFCAGAAAHGPASEPAPDAPEFEPPAAGTYTLPPIQDAPSGTVVDGRGKSRRLAEFTQGRFTLLGLVYTRCGDPAGCPRATWAFESVRGMLRTDPALESKVRLVTLSFDPVHDTPATLAAYARRVGALKPGAEWQFLTTGSRAALDPILEGFGQDLRVAKGSKARPGTEAFSHTLKVFLLDPAGRVREIYSSAFLVPEVLVNDLRTLALEQR